MSGKKGFTIVTLLLLLLSFVLLSVGNTETMSDKEFEKNYKKTLIAELDYPLNDVISKIKRSNQVEPLYDYLDNPWIVSDLHRKRFTIAFSYREELSTVLKIKEVKVQSKNTEFVQTDGIIESDDTKSFVVINLVGKIPDEGHIIVSIFYEENKLGFVKRDLVIPSKDIDEVVELILEEYLKFKESEIQL